MNEFRDRVRSYRLKNGITQQELADRCNLSRQTIVAIENRDHYYVNLITRHKIESVLEKGEKE